MEERFIKTKSQAGVSFIKDAKDGSLVAIIQKGKRPEAHTEAMIQVMLDALNQAVKVKRNE